MLFFYFILLCPLTYTHQHPPRTFRNEKVTCVINILKIETVIDRKGRHIREFGIPGLGAEPREPGPAASHLTSVAARVVISCVNTEDSQRPTLWLETMAPCPAFLPATASWEQGRPLGLWLWSSECSRFTSPFAQHEQGRPDLVPGPRARPREGLC